MKNALISADDITTLWVKSKAGTYALKCILSNVGNYAHIKCMLAILCMFVSYVSIHIFILYMVCAHVAKGFIFIRYAVYVDSFHMSIGTQHVT